VCCIGASVMRLSCSGRGPLLTVVFMLRLDTLRTATEGPPPAALHRDECDQPIRQRCWPCAVCGHARPDKLVVLADTTSRRYGCRLSRAGPAIEPPHTRRAGPPPCTGPRCGPVQGLERAVHCTPIEGFSGHSGDEIETCGQPCPAEQGIAVSVLLQPRRVGRASRPTPVPRTLS
jgi:hypothetical protein